MCSSVVSRKESNISPEPANLLLGLIQHMPLLMFGLTRYVAKIQTRAPLTNKVSRQKVFLQISNEREQEGWKHTYQQKRGMGGGGGSWAKW